MADATTARADRNPFYFFHLGLLITALGFVTYTFSAELGIGLLVTIIMLAAFALFITIGYCLFRAAGFHPFVASVPTRPNSQRTRS
jgi:hypothetical protein